METKMTKKTKPFGGPYVPAGNLIRVLRMWTTDAYVGELHQVVAWSDDGHVSPEEYNGDQNLLPKNFPMIADPNGSTHVVAWEAGNAPVFDPGKDSLWSTSRPQVGHYSNPGKVEPIDLIRDLGLMPGFAAGNVIKYVSRYDKKNGVEDLKKARVYLDWLIEAVS